MLASPTLTTVFPAEIERHEFVRFAAPNRLRTPQVLELNRIERPPDCRSDQSPVRVAPGIRGDGNQFDRVGDPRDSSRWRQIFITMSMASRTFGFGSVLTCDRPGLLLENSS